MGGEGKGWVENQRWVKLSVRTVWTSYVPEVPAIGPNMLEWHKSRFPITAVDFRHMPSMLHPPWVPLSQS